jgi:hypothetical protein
MSTAWSERSGLPRRPDTQIADRRWPLAVAAVLFVAVLASDLLDFGAYRLRYPLLNAGSPSSWSHDLTPILLAAGAVACLLGARHETGRRATWLATAAVLAFLFVDEITSLHADVDSLSYGKLVYVPALLVVVICMWRLTAGGAHAPNLRVAFGVLLLGYAVHVVGPHVHARGLDPGGWANQVRVGTKEGAELAGLALALQAVASVALSAPTRSARWRA